MSWLYHLTDWHDQVWIGILYVLVVGLIVWNVVREFRP